MKRPWKSALVGSACALVLGSEAWAQTREFSIGAGELKAALDAYARQSGQQIIYRVEDVRGRQSPGVHGALERDAALDRLLAGTGLEVRRDSSGAIAVVRSPTRPPAEAAPEPEAVPLAELVVTGTRLPGGKQDSTPVNSYSTEVVARSGQTTLAAFLSTLPEVSVVSASPITNFGGQATVRLRGLPAGTTLVLLDGRRLASSGVGAATAVVDLNAFAPDLLERVDIVPTGSSAIYGSDAIGGVINLVTRKRFSGAGGAVSRSFADDYEESRVAVAVGQEFSRGSLSLVATYREQDSLQLSDRALTADSDFRRFAHLGGTDQRQQWCDPGTVFAASGLLNGVGTASAGIPTGAQARPALADFAQSAGRPNLCDYYPASVIIPRSRGVSGLVSGEFKVADQITLYADLLYAKYDTDGRFLGVDVNRLSTPAANAFNPFGQAVLVSTLIPVLNGTDAESEVSRPLLGARGSWGANWSWDAAVWRSTTRDDVSQVIRNNAALASALGSSDPATALNVFRPALNSKALLDSIFTRQTNLYRARQTGADAVLRGRLLELPGGPLAVALGWEGGRERIDRTLLGSGSPVSTAGRRETYSMFVEARAPLLPGDGRAGHMLQVNLAARHDHYSDFGSTTTPQVAIEYRPLSRLSLRAAYSEAFKAPTLIQLFAGRTTVTAPLRDPKLGVSVPITITNGGNPALQPETGEASTFTATWRDPERSNLRLSATYFVVQQQSRIVTPIVTAILNNEEMFPGRVTRGAPAPGASIGPVTSVDNTNLNFGGLKLSGLDVSASFDVRLGPGVLSPHVALTRTLKYTSQITPGAPYVDRLSRAASSDVWAPRYKANAGLTWAQDSFVLSARGRYVGRYLDYQTPSNSNELGDYWTFDASAEGRLSALPLIGDVAPEGVYARIAVSNLFDRGPKYSNYGSGIWGFDPSVDDILGRTVTLSVGKHF